MRLAPRWQECPRCVASRQSIFQKIFFLRSIADSRDTWKRGFSRFALRGVPVIGLLELTLAFLGLLSMLKGWHLDATVYGEGPSYDRLFYGIPGYHDDGHLRQSRRREREKDRRAEESRRHR
jgi:hypothetical protein